MTNTDLTDDTIEALITAREGGLTRAAVHQLVDDVFNTPWITAHAGRPEVLAEIEAIVASAYRLQALNDGIDMQAWDRAAVERAGLYKQNMRRTP